jgi:hypothetical protein
MANIIHWSEDDTQIKLLSIFTKEHNGNQSVRDEGNQKITTKKKVLCRKRKNYKQDG